MNDLALEGLFQVVRLQILTPKDYRVPGYGTDASYKFAWDEEVYPYFHEGVTFHIPFEKMFKTSGKQVKEIAEFLDDKWMEKEKITFYQLEDKYGRHGEDWHRSKLIDICQYLCLKGMFGKDFWTEFSSDAPTEASGIISEYKPY